MHPLPIQNSLRYCYLINWYVCSTSEKHAYAGDSWTYRRCSAQMRYPPPGRQLDRSHQLHQNQVLCARRGTDGLCLSSHWTKRMLSCFMRIKARDMQAYHRLHGRVSSQVIWLLRQYTHAWFTFRLFPFLDFFFPPLLSSSSNASRESRLDMPAAEIDGAESVGSIGISEDPPG